MKMKLFFLAAIFTLSMFCACNNNTVSDTNTNNSGNFSEVIYMEDTDTSVTIIEMP